MNVGTMHNSPVQQGEVQATQTQSITYSAQEIADLTRLVKDVASHLDELRLDVAQRRRAEAQLATLRAQISDAPDYVIVKRAGRILWSS